MRRVLCCLLAGVVLGLVPGSPARGASPADELTRLDARLADVVQDLSAARARLVRIRSEQAASRDALAHARKRRREATGRVRRFAVEAYKRGADDYFGAILLSRGGNDLAVRRTYVASLTRRDAAALGDLRAAVDDGETALQHLDTLERAEAERLASLEGLQRDLVRGQAAQRKLLTQSAAATPKAAPRAPATAAAAPSTTPPPPTQTGEAFVITCYSGGGSTATGTRPHPGTAAVDPAVIPLGSHFQIEGLGTYTAEDTGGDIRGRRADIWHESAEWCAAFGRRTRTVHRLD